ncbi:replication initiator protein RepSA [Streptacidiphilus anmyonensis]|uniref:replication initiator protein RepSA n=1 Tax=Streptacidiphilus anmyonensis TaxID=405782 RepID=UPI000A97B6AE|nr:replication initiator protein RepSA [Streptacidiphilus anmyonensis]
MTTTLTRPTDPPLTGAVLGRDLEPVEDLARLAARGDLPRLVEQIRRTGGCANPVNLWGSKTIRHLPTGLVLSEYSTADEPGGRLKVACGNRRATRCPTCSQTYAADTYHLIRAGLVGDQTKDVPATVRDCPRVFATLTAPSFGPVHNRPDTGCCRCGKQHPKGAPALGSPLDPERYDYAHAVLWNNWASELWRRFTIYLRRELAKASGLTRRDFDATVKLAFGKVAEYQRRGAVHFHAVIRLDGADAPGTTPPAWATVSLLDRAIRSAARAVTVPLDAAGPHPARVLRWGEQVDVRPVRAFGDGSEITEQAVASYVAKYATKAAEVTDSVDRRLHSLGALADYDLPDHTRRLIETCWELDDAYPERLLAHWSHMLGFRGHFSSKSPRYSTTLGALRQARVDYRAQQAHEELRERLLAAGLPDLDDLEHDGETLVLAHWVFAGQGHTPGESVLAATIAEQIQHNRTAAREERLSLLQDREEEQAWTAC